MAATFSQIKSGLDDIASRIKSARTTMGQIKANTVTVESDLAQLGNDYGALVGDIDAAAAAAPTDAALANAKAEKDQLVAEFLTLQAVATATKNANTVA